MTTLHPAPAADKPEALRVEKMLREALGSEDGRLRALVDALDLLDREHVNNRRLTARLERYAFENIELHQAVLALRRRLREEGRDIDTEKDAA